MIRRKRQITIRVEWFPVRAVMQATTGANDVNIKETGLIRTLSVIMCDFDFGMPGIEYMHDGVMAAFVND